MLMSLAWCFMRSLSNPVVAVHGTNLASILISQKKTLLSVNISVSLSDHFSLPESLCGPCFGYFWVTGWSRSIPSAGRRCIGCQRWNAARPIGWAKSRTRSPRNRSQTSGRHGIFCWENEDIFCSYSAAIQQWYFLRWGNGEDICLGNTPLNSN